MKQTVSILLPVIVFCAGCSSQPVQTHEYLLRPQTSSSEADYASTVVLGRVEVAPYLDHEGIVLEVASGEINTAQHNRWAEPMAFAVRRYLQVAIGNAANTGVGNSLIETDAATTQIDVYVYQFHGSTRGIVKLAAEWTLQDTETGEIRAQDDFSETEALHADGYADVVRAHAALLEALAQSIAAEL